MAADVAVFAAKKQQRFPSVNFCVFYFCDEDRVIPGYVRVDHRAAQLQRSAFQHGNAAGSPAIAQRQPLFCFGVLFALREIF